MNAYRRILAAIDLTQDSRTVAGRACEIARAGNASVRLLHVMEVIPIEPMSESAQPVMQIDDGMLKRLRQQIQALAQQLDLPAEAAAVEAGNVKSEILRCAREQNVDLIVLGCRERHGLSILLHRTEDSVLHGAPCDVLAVRVR
jgi:universal stress protein A